MFVLGGDLYEDEVVDKDGFLIGSVGHVYLDDETGQPSWVTVKIGLFGTKVAFVPISRARVTAKQIRVPYSAEFVKDAPNVAAERLLSASQEAVLRGYYDGGAGADTASSAAGSGVPDDAA